MTREDWLNVVAQQMRPLFKQAGADLPKRFRVTMSLTNKKKRVGVCFSPECSADGTHEILIRLDQHEPIDVAEILAHELTHAAVGLKCGHRGPFAKVAKAIGLEGKMTATKPGLAFKAFMEPVLAAVGPFPHASLNWNGERNSGPAKKKTYLKKVTCSECGYICRVTEQWLNDVGPPHCPEHGPMAEA